LAGPENTRDVFSNAWSRLAALVVAASAVLGAIAVTQPSYLAAHTSYILVLVGIGEATTA